MLTLKIERGRYLRVRRGMDGGEISRRFNCPVAEDVREGQIVPLLSGCRYVFAHVGDSYASIAARERVREEDIIRLNGVKPVYPARRIWLPER